MVSLSYNNHLERLTVGVYEGRSFESEGSSPIGTVYIYSVCSISFIILWITNITFGMVLTSENYFLKWINFRRRSIKQFMFTSYDCKPVL